MKRLFVSLCSISVLTLTGCSSSVNITKLKPAEIEQAAQTKVLQVAAFEYDDIGFANRLESAIANKSIQGKPFFTVLPLSPRKPYDFNQVQMADDFSPVVRGVVHGKVELYQTHYTRFFASRYKTVEYTCYKDSKGKEVKYYRHYDRDNKREKKRDDIHRAVCSELHEYTVLCREMNSKFSANIRLTDVINRSNIHSGTYQATQTHQHCIGDYGSLPDESNVISELMNDVSQQFVNRISPNLVYQSVTLLDDPEIDYSKEQEQLLEYAIDYIEQGRMEKAERLLTQLFDSTDKRCFVAAYNLGVIAESNGEYREALAFYRTANDLSLKPNDEINRAIRRIQTSIRDQAIVETQL